MCLVSIDNINLFRIRHQNHCLKLIYSGDSLDKAEGINDKEIEKDKVEIEGSSSGDATTGSAQAAVNAQAQPSSAEDKPAPGYNAEAAQQAKKPKSISDLAIESNNPEAIAIKDKIEAIKRERSKLIHDIKRVRSRLAFKIASSETVSKLIDMSYTQEQYEDAVRKLHKLNGVKRRLDFRVSTEASSLSDEKALIKKIKDVDVDLDEALHVVKLFRKRDLVKKDLEELNAELSKLNKQIKDQDTELDTLYSNLRRILKIGDRDRTQQTVKRKEERPRNLEINLEDIAVIKKRK
jgi:uncharacterized coiled-coil DUF342 family protein